MIIAIKHFATRFTSKKVWWLFTLCLCTANPLSAFASSLHISPVRIFFEQGQSITSINVKNRGDAPVLVQSELMVWKQVDGKSVYEATEDLIISPPIFELPSRQSQTVRLALKNAAVPDVEKTYRVFLTEVPVAGETTASADKKSGNMLKISLRIGLPIFVAPTHSTNNLEFSIRQSCEDQSWSLSAANRGTTHDRVLGFDIKNESTNEVLLQSAETRYILANSTVNWQLDAKNQDLPPKVQANVRYYPLRTEELLIEPIKENCGINLSSTANTTGG